MRRHLLRAVAVLLLSCASVFAQQTTGSITGRVLDQQSAAVPGATVTAKSASTGFTRTEVSDAEGIYRLGALPVGNYDVTAELQRLKAAHGRSNGRVLQVVTKSGTNAPSGSVFEFFRDKSMNSLSETERLPEIEGTGAAVKGDYRRNQFGGSFGGPIVKDKLHFF